MAAGRPRKIKNAKALETAWVEYKAQCDNQFVITHEFNQRSGNFVSKQLEHRVTYTIEGFCVFIGLSRSKFYQNYANDERYKDVVELMKEECETDARVKFELGEIDPRLAPLWMSKYGYSAKTDTDITGAVPVVITGGDMLED